MMAVMKIAVTLVERRRLIWVSKVICAVEGHGMQMDVYVRFVQTSIYKQCAINIISLLLQDEAILILAPSGNGLAKVSQN